MLKIFHNKTVNGLASWLGIASAAYAVLANHVPQWFGQLSLPQSILAGIALALATTLVAAVIVAIAGIGFRHFKPLPAPPVESDMPTPAQRLESRLIIIGSCRGSVIGFREKGGYFTDYIVGGGPFMQIRRHLDPSFIADLERLRHSPADELLNDKLPDLANRWLDEVDKVAERWGIE